MCGISGFTFEDATILKAMNSRLAHRGPDDEGNFVSPEVSLGHRRLSIIDLSKDGHQPMFSADGQLCIVFNGEIFNYIELREELKKCGHVFKTKSDTEVILHAYQTWGEECLHRFNGMWSFAIYDLSKQTLFLSRDRFGVKPLYYSTPGKHLIFASEIKALLAHENLIARRLNERALFDYMCFNAVDFGRETFFEGIFRLEPGHQMTFDLKARELKISQYYHFAKSNPRSTGSAERLRDIFFNSVSLRLRSDVPVGSSLSGGIDSSSIVSTITKRFGSDSKLETFSIVFPGSAVDESSYIDTVLADTKCSFNKAEPTLEGFFKDLEDFVYYQEEPVRTTSMYAHYELMRKVKERNIVVLLEGQGADELFGGYVPWMTFQVMVHYLKRLNLKRVARELFCAARLYGTSIRKLVFGFSQHALLGSSLVKNAYFLSNRTVLSPVFFRLHRSKSIVHGFKSPISIKDSLKWRFQLGLTALLRYGDKNSMRFSIENRFPFLDYRLVEYVFSQFSTEDFIENAVTKKLFRESMMGTTANRILERHDKIGFETPQAAWFRSPTFIQFFRALINSPSFKSRPYWQHEKVQALFEAHLRGPSDRSNDLWKIMNVELWSRRFIDHEQP